MKVFKSVMSIAIALALCLLFSGIAMATALDGETPVLHLTFNDSDEDCTLNGTAILEDGVVKLPGGEMRTGYVSLPYMSLLDTDDEVTISMWCYIPSGTEANNYIIGFSNANDWPAFFGCVLPTGQISINFDIRGVMDTEAIYPFDAWTFFTLSISKTQMNVYLNGELAASYDGKTDTCLNCGWRTINGVDAGTTHYHELDKINLVSGYLGSPPYTINTNLQSDMTGMIDEYSIYATALDAEQARELYEAQTVPVAAWPIGAAAVEDQAAAVVTLPETDETGLRHLYTFDEGETGYQLMGGATVSDSILNLPGGVFRNGGYIRLDDNALINCVTEVTINTWINLADGTTAGGDQFLFSFNSGDAWPAFYCVVLENGTLALNLDYRGQLIVGEEMKFNQWMYLSCVVSGDEVSVYFDGELVSQYSKNSLKTTGGRWEKLNVQTDSTHYADVDHTYLATGRIGSGFTDLGYNKVDMMGQLDDFSIYSVAMTADEIAALYESECNATGY